jgi:hypothetical protein
MKKINAHFFEMVLHILGTENGTWTILELEPYQMSNNHKWMPEHEGSSPCPGPGTVGTKCTFFSILSL